jgi:riboflavin biosynthesis pyrimidine reductase
MGKVLYSVTMSLDGFIAGPGGDMSWLTEHLGPNPMVDEVIGKIGALLVGNRTFRGDDPYLPRRAFWPGSRHGWAAGVRRGRTAPRLPAGHKAAAPADRAGLAAGQGRQRVPGRR